MTKLLAPLGTPRQLPKGRDLGRVHVPERLPSLVKHYLANGAGEEVPVVESVTVWGRWRMRMGPLWAPGTWQAYYRFPDEMIRTMRLYVARIPVLHGLDTCDLAKKEARTVIAGRVLDQGDKVVEAAAMAPWIDSLVFRSTAIFSNEVRWDERGAETVAMSYTRPNAFRAYCCRQNSR